MPDDLPQANGLPLEWSSMLDKVQQALSQAQADVDRRALAYPTLPETQTSSDDWDSHWRLSMQQLEERTAAMQKHLQEQEEQTTAVELELGAGEDELRQWLTAIREIQRSLVNREGAEV